jgi:hypothetical protein
MTELPKCEHCKEKPVRVVKFITHEGEYHADVIGRICEDCVSKILKSDLGFYEKMQLMVLRQFQVDQ